MVIDWPPKGFENFRPWSYRRYCDHIAKAHDIRRSTFYTHFRDKDEILGAIARDYTEALRDVIARLPGPVPTRNEIDEWLQAMTAFALKERIPTELLMFVAHVVV